MGLNVLIIDTICFNRLRVFFVKFSFQKLSFCSKKLKLKVIATVQRYNFLFYTLLKLLKMTRLNCKRKLNKVR